MMLKLIRGSSRDMKEIKDNSTHLIFTSPPYHTAKDYSVVIHDDMGNSSGYESYLSSLDDVWRECIRVLVPGGHLAINIDNTTVDGVIYPCAVDVFSRVAKMIPLQENIYWIKPPQLGDKRGNHIKKNPFPRYYYPYRCVEPIYVFKKPGKLYRRRLTTDRIPDEIARAWAFNDWHIPTVVNGKHPAAFPEELAERFIKLYTETDEIVGDPFAGSGTVMAVSKHLNRSSWGYEVNQTFIDIIKERCKWKQQTFGDAIEYKYIPR